MKPKLIKQMLLAFFAIVVMCVLGAYDVNPVPGMLIAGLAIAPIVSVESSLEMKQRRGQYIKDAQAILDLCKQEKRGLTADEQTKYDDLTAKADALEPDIKRMEAQERRMAESVDWGKRSEEEQKEIRSYNILRAIGGFSANKLDGIEREMHEEAENEGRSLGYNITGLGIPTRVIDFLAGRNMKRAMSATGGTNGSEGGMMIPVEKEGLIMALRPMLVLAGLGVKTFGNVVGNIDKVKGTSTSATWGGENDEAGNTDVTTSKVTISPKRLAAKSLISKQLLYQTSQSMQDDVLNDILAAIAQAVELAAINGASGGNNPVGLLNTSGIGSVVGGTNGAAPTYPHLTELESKVQIANALQNALGYLTNPAVKNKLKNTKLDAGSGLFVWPQNGVELNGYKAAVSNLVPSNLTKGTASGVCSAIMFGDWSQLEIYNWGPLDITIDPLTRADYFQTKLIVNSLWDVFVKRPEAFAAMVDATTT